MSPSDDCEKYELHINADISLAIRQLAYAIGSVSQELRQLAEELADFWMSRVTWLEEKKQFGIVGLFVFPHVFACSRVTGGDNYYRCLLLKELCPPTSSIILLITPPTQTQPLSCLFSCQVNCCLSSHRQRTLVVRHRQFTTSESVLSHL